MILVRNSMLRSALLASASAAVALPAFAQTQQTKSGVEVSEIVVTGSRIPRVEFEGNIPGVAVSGQEVERRSFTNALDVLNDIPLVGIGTALNTNGGQPSSLGVAFVDLLDLGTARTLTLVNGRRFVSGNSATLFVSGNETGSQVDVNSIPVSLIDRVDVLTVGGAATYGSDAIAGVVNYILKDRYEGAEVSFVGGVSDRGDAGQYSLRALVGRNLLDDRANLVFSFEYNSIDGYTADQREFRANNPSSVTNYLNGGIRNAAFDPRALATGSNTAFLAATTDKAPGNAYLSDTRSIQVFPSGVIFNALGATGGPTAAPVNQIGPAAAGFFAGNTQLISGVPVACIPDAVNICQFAPTSVTAAQAAATFARFGITPPAGSTPAQQAALAANILQANRPTPRDFFAANPSAGLNSFLGTFIPSFPDVANTNPATASFLARTAVPIRFTDSGVVETYTVATLGPTTPGTVGGAPGSQGFNPIGFTVSRVDQQRKLGNVFGNFKVLPNVTFFTENLYSKIESRSRRDQGGLASSAASGTVENAALVVNVNNPFLDAADRSALAAAGITNNFILSRTNQDIFGDNSAVADQETFRTANGLRGDFNLFDREFSWEASASYGKVTADVTQGRLRDLEYALALDSVVNPANGQVVCRAQLQPQAFLGLSPPGVSPNLIRVVGADGIAREQIFTPVVTQDLINSCAPLNPFGFNQMSTAAKNYVAAKTTFHNESEQTFLQAFFNGTALELPGGPAKFSLAAEYRKDELAFSTDEINRLGRTRSAPSAQTSGQTETYEFGAELRIPIFGGEFRYPGLYSLEFSPAIRYSRQDGASPTYRNLAGNLVTQKSKGDFEKITSFAATYQPIRDITFRGNITESLRNPSVTELFLGGQPAFVTPTDPCSNANINSGPVPTTRRANCEAAAVTAGLAANAAAAATFLNSFVASGRAVQGTFSGSPTLSPERADSKTVGVLLEPRWVPGLRISVDYIVLKLRDQIIPTNLAQALQFCYDSTTFPDTSAQFGSNTCSFFVRDPQFQVTDGFASGFLNLSATRIKAYNASYEYPIPLDRILGDSRDWGTLRLKGNIYRLDEYATSAAGNYSDTQNSAGSANAGRPEWEIQQSLRYSNGPLDLSWTATWNSALKLFSGGVPVTVEQSEILRVEDVWLHSATIGYEIAERVRVQFTVDNITDVTTFGREGILTGLNQSGYFDTLGRRYTATLRAKF